MDIGQVPPIEAEATPPDIRLKENVSMENEKPLPPPTTMTWPEQTKQSHLASNDLDTNQNHQNHLNPASRSTNFEVCNSGSSCSNNIITKSKSHNQNDICISEVNGNNIRQETLIETSCVDEDIIFEDEESSVMTNIVEIDSSHSSDQSFNNITLQLLANQQQLQDQRLDQVDGPTETGQSSSIEMTRARVSAGMSQRKAVGFDSVTLFYFPRSQGFSSIPSQGGSTLGMSNKHFKRRKFSVDLFEEVKRRSRREILLKIRFDSDRGSRSKSAARNNRNKNNNKSGGNRSSEQSEREDGDDNEEESFDQIRCNSTSSSTSSPTPSTTTTSDDDDDNESGDRDDEDSSFSEFSDISDTELEANNFIFLQPIGVKLRRSLLRASGVGRIDPAEKRECKKIRESRDRAGCKCVNQCIPGLCECSKLGVNCHVDRGTFPCGCISSGCQNPMGRTEYDPKRVKVHCYDKLGVS